MSNVHVDRLEAVFKVNNGNKWILRLERLQLKVTNTTNAPIWSNTKLQGQVVFNLRISLIIQLSLLLQRRRNHRD